MLQIGHRLNPLSNARDPRPFARSAYYKASSLSREEFARIWTEQRRGMAKTDLAHTLATVAKGRPGD